METDTTFISTVVRIKVVGVGGGGNSVVARLAKDKLPGIELIGVNSDAKQLGVLQAEGVETLQIGERLTKGRGSGGVPAIGREAAETDEKRLHMILRDADMVFITAGMGGGIGTGASPVIAGYLREMGILSIGVVTAPFSFEGKRKMQTANEGISRLQGLLDGLIVIHNDNLMKVINDRKTPLAQAFKAADDVLRQAIRCISEVILTTGMINVDFADVRAIFRQSRSSDAILGIGTNEEGRVIEAVKKAIESPLIERPLDGARGIILNISGDESLSLYEVTEATEFIDEHTHPEVNIILGAVIEKGMGNKVRATLVATDFVDSVISAAPPLTSRDLGKAVGNASPNVTEPEEPGAQRKVPPTASLHSSRPPEISVPDFMEKKTSPIFPAFSPVPPRRPET